VATSSLLIRISFPGYVNHRWIFNSTHWRAVYYADNVGECGNLTGTGYPGARVHAVAWTDTASMLFGGYGHGPLLTNGDCEQNYLNDLYTNFVPFEGTVVADRAKIGVYGARGVFSVDNWPGGRLGSTAWSDKYANHYIYGGYGYAESMVGGYLGDLWRWSNLDGGFTWVAGPKVIDQLSQQGTYGEALLDHFPSCRCHSQVWESPPFDVVWIFGKENSIYLFLVRKPRLVCDSSDAEACAGGLTLSGSVNDLWVFDMRGMLGRTSAPLGFAVVSVPTAAHPLLPPYGTALSASHPGARHGGKCWSSPNGFRFFLFGGFGVASGGANGALGDLWSLSCNVGEQQSPSDETTCDACSATGTFNALLGDNCTYCATGSIPSSNRTACDICATGSVSFYSDICTTCGAGMESSGDRGSCVACAAGYFSATSGTMCLPCSAGQTSTRDNTGCVSCGPVAYSLSPGGTCAACPLGTVSNANMTSCETCPVGSIRNSSMTSCASCGEGMLSDANRTRCVWRKLWGWIRGSAGGNPVGNYSFPGTFNPAAIPAARQYPAWARDSIGNVWMFGGLGSGGGQLSDLWKWNGVSWMLVSGTSDFDSYPVLDRDSQWPGGTVHAMAWPSPDGGFQIFGGVTVTGADWGGLAFLSSC